MARSRNVPMMTLFLVLFTVSVGFGLVIPILPLIARDFGASAFMLGMMTAGYSVVQFLFAPWWGQLSDRIGRKPVLMIGITGLALSFLLMGFSQSFTGLFAGRVFGGLLGSATLPAAQALAAELSGTSSRAKAMGLMGAAFGTGFIVGPLVGGVLAPLGMSVPFFASAALGAGTVVLSWAVLREPDKSEQNAAVGPSKKQGMYKNMAKALTGPGTPYYLLAFVIMFGQSSLMTALAFFLTDRFGVSASIVGVVFALNGGFGALIQGVAIERITTRLGEYPTILLGLGVGIVGYSLLVIAPVLGVAMIATVLTAVSMSLTRPSATSLLSQVTPLPQGITMGLQGSFDSLGRVIGPLWAGFAYDHMQILPFLSASASFLLMWMYLRARRHQTASIPQMQQTSAK